MTPEEVRQLVLSFPETEEGMSYGRPSFKVKGKFFTRIRAEDDSLVLLEVPFDEREMLMEVDPETFHITPHYKDYPSVLARIESLDPGSLRNFLERRWRKVVPKKLQREWDAARGATA
ncbi:MAG TPA: MmcQ/YjbR family DNA-binding protein [Phenylobacterium sp.]